LIAAKWICQFTKSAVRTAIWGKKSIAGPVLAHETEGTFLKK
jgi:hypothetical protein